MLAFGCIYFFFTQKTEYVKSGTYQANCAKIDIVRRDLALHSECTGVRLLGQSRLKGGGGRTGLDNGNNGVGHGFGSVDRFAV
jgi:hypothetical protein